MKELFSSWQSWLREEIKPIANEIDRNSQALKTALETMGNRSWLALKVPVELGGSGLTELEYRLTQIDLARISGALTFLQTQHQSAANMLSKSDNMYLQRQFLPNMATGKALMGVGFSHLRRRGIPMVSGVKTSLGYEISGEIPWITGYGFFSHFILGITLEDGRELYGVLPLQNQTQDAGGSIICSQPMELLAISSTNTVNAKISRWCLNGDRVIAIKSPGSIHHRSRQNILNHGWYAIGCAYAGLDILLASAEKKQLDFLYESWRSFNLEVAQCREKTVSLTENNNTAYKQKLELRAEAISLAQRCSQAAVIASGGAANYLNSNAARVYREALLFSVSGQTTDVMETSIRRLANTN